MSPQGLTVLPVLRLDSGDAVDLIPKEMNPMVGEPTGGIYKTNPIRAVTGERAGERARWAQYAQRIAPPMLRSDHIGRYARRRGAHRHRINDEGASTYGCERRNALPSLRPTI